MKPKHFFSILLCLLFVGCSSHGPARIVSNVEVEIVNQSSWALENASVYFGKYDCKWGHVGKTFSASYMFYPHPITAKAELHWDEGGKHRTESLDLNQIYSVGKSGRLTFIVRDDRVEVQFHEKS